MESRIIAGMTSAAGGEDLFKGRQFDQEIIVLCVRWYLRYKLSARDLVEMMTERGVLLAHTTILRWVQRYVPEFEKRWSRYAGREIDFYLSEKRDITAAKHFLRKAMKSVGAPRVITLDAYAASHRAVAELKSEGMLPGRVRVRSSKYLNNVIEQDHRRIKQRVRPMLGFKRFDYAAVTISGIELAQKIKKHQFKTGKLAGRSATVPEIWAAVLAA